ncbi:hypothetical protein ABW21_db0200055 [Orbilia brochopaga]|nr:hypothetical protein ABW21_db0200055 [Drechslerella brochopaga]
MCMHSRHIQMRVPFMYNVLPQSVHLLGVISHQITSGALVGVGFPLTWAEDFAIGHRTKTSDHDSQPAITRWSSPRDVPVREMREIAAGGQCLDEEISVSSQCSNRRVPRACVISQARVAVRSRWLMGLFSIS